MEQGSSEVWDHSSNSEFYDYYAKESSSPETLDRFRRIQEMLLRVMGKEKAGTPLSIADIGCGAGRITLPLARSGAAV
ncbi:MAG TPA: hypothetical protein PLK99_07610, partial [Burkholderiales bacterium]|nr:hypothetical protein [Burkholderiales bacterium]